MSDCFTKRYSLTVNTMNSFIKALFSDLYTDNGLMNLWT
jgi:hypothetical protein